MPRLAAKSQRIKFDYRLIIVSRRMESAVDVANKDRKIRSERITNGFRAGSCPFVDHSLSRASF